jgi:hypothetical protein
VRAWLLFERYHRSINHLANKSPPRFLRSRWHCHHLTEIHGEQTKPRRSTLPTCFVLGGSISCTPPTTCLDRHRRSLY